MPATPTDPRAPVPPVGATGAAPGVPTAPDPHDDPRSVGDLLGELISESTTLVKQEITLAKTEVTRDVKAAAVSAGAAAAGGAVAYAGFIALVIGLGWGLGELLGGLEWLGITIAGLIVAAIGAVMLKGGLEKLKDIDPAPERTIQTLKEDKQWLKDQTA